MHTMFNLNRISVLACGALFLLCGFALPQSTEPQMVVPKVTDVVTHTSHLSCPKGYGEWFITNALYGETTGSDNQVIFKGSSGKGELVTVETYEVCVSPSFVQQLKKANEQH